MTEDIERQILGTMIYDAKVIPDVSQVLHPSAFTTTTNRLIYDAIIKCYDRHGSCDVTLCTSELEKQGQLNRIGGGVYLYDIQARIVESDNIDFYVSELREVWLKRQIASSANLIKTQAETNGELSASELLDQSQAIFYRLDAHNSTNDIKSSDEILGEVVDKIVDPTTSGIKTGFIELDLMGSIEGGQLIIIAARPGIGKSTLVTNILMNIRTIYNRPILIFSMEMPAREILLRVVSLTSRLPFTDLKKGIIGNKQQLIDAVTRIQHQPIFIKDEAGIHINTLRANARKMKREYPNLAAIAIDYIQLVRTDSKAVRELEVAEITRSSKNLAMELDIPVFGVSQLSRANERRTNREPQLSDNRESGEIEASSDVVLMLDREDAYDNEVPSGTIDCYIKKNRNGPLGKIVLGYDKPTFKMYNL